MSDELIVVKPGAVLQDRYEIVERVARGGFAIVWRAHDRLLGKDVALKVLHHAIADDEAAVEELKQETLRSRELTHENIVQVYDFLRDGDVVAIAMEYIEGETLSALAAKRPGQCFEPDDLAGWLGDICDALEYAHAERGKKRTVVHHDLKPGNFMVDRYGTVKVLDFGISKTITETQIHHTGQFVVAGTPPYMSPQQLKGQRPCPSDDVYSFGATLYALLTGKPPFFRGDIQVQIPSEIPPSMTERRREFELDLPPVPDDWEKVVATCLAKDAADRPGSMGEIALALGVREPSSRRSVRLSEAAGGDDGSGSPAGGVALSAADLDRGGRGRARRRGSGDVPTAARGGTGAGGRGRSPAGRAAGAGSGAGRRGGRAGDRRAGRRGCTARRRAGGDGSPGRAGRAGARPRARGSPGRRP